MRRSLKAGCGIPSQPKELFTAFLETGPPHTASLRSSAYCVVSFAAAAKSGRLLDAVAATTMLVAQPTPDAAHWRPHCTSVIPHPLFPHGAKHFLHPCEHLRPGVDVVIPGLPFPLRAPQSQTNSGDPTGRAVWRGASVMAARILKHEGRQRRGVAIPNSGSVHQSANLKNSSI